MSYDVEISTSVAVMQCLLAIGYNYINIYIVFDSLLSLFSPIANRHCITATTVEISTSQFIYIMEA